MTRSRRPVQTSKPFTAIIAAVEWVEWFQGPFVHFAHAGADDAGFSLVFVNAPKGMDGNGRRVFDVVIGTQVMVKARQLYVGGKLWAVLDGRGMARLCGGK